MSSEKAISYHSITFGLGNDWKNTWDDWHLVPSSRPLVSPPGVKTSYLEIPGGDGSLDMTTMLTSKPRYAYRSGTWQFIVINSGQLEPNSIYPAWHRRYSDIMSFLHGKKLRAILDDDPNYFYEGRFSVSGWQSGKGNSVISINYVVFPYKRLISNENSKAF